MSRRLALVPAVLVASSLPASAQISSSLQGRVFDVTGAPIQGAVVVVTEDSTGSQRRTSTTGEGLFDATQVEPGQYSLAVTAAGFAPLTRHGVTLATGSTTRVDLQLSAGSEAQTVNVTADAPLLQEGQSDIQMTIPGQQVVGLPLNGRNFVLLAQLAPGVSLPPGTLLPRINGGRPRTNEYLFDGISALQPEPGQVAFFPIIDDIAEFTVEANNVPAEFGRFNGGVVNVTTRSGSNAVHFSLYDFFRNEDLNARNYFSRTGRKPEYRRNQYGGTLGLPLWRDRLFFFGGYQGQKLLEGITRISTLPTVAQRQGIFTGTHIYDPATTTAANGQYVRTEFPGDVINRPFDPAAAAILAQLPLPTNLSATANNYTRTANDADHQNQFDSRFDVAAGRRDRAFVRYSYFSDVEQPVYPLPMLGGAITGTTVGTGNVAGLSNVLGQQAVVNETHTFGVRSLNDLRAGYTRRSNVIAGPQLDTTPSAALGIPGIPSNGAFANALPLFTFSNGDQQIGPSASTNSNYQTGVWELVDTYATQFGRHALKAGVDLRWYQLNTIAPPNPTGSFAFTTTGTGLPSVAGSGNALASFLLGQVDTFQIDLQQSKLRPRDFIEEYFVQDDWRVTPTLTLNLGARWTLHHPSVEKNNQGAVFNLATQELDYLGVDGNPRSARELHPGNVAPRVGFTLALTPKTVMRSGYGIVFIDQSGITTPFTTPQFPFIQSVAQRTQDNVNAAFDLSSGPTVSPIPLTPDAGLGQSVYAAQRALGSGYVQQWNLAVQREVSPNLSFEVAYVGSHIVHVGIPDQNLNQLTAAQLAEGAPLLQKVTNPYYGQLPASSTIGTKTIAAAQLLKPYPRFQNVAYYRNNTGTTNYNALEVKVEKRLSHNLSLLGSYTKSKLIDDASSVFSSTVLSSPNTSSLVAADTNRPYLERDASNGDTPNVGTASVLYQFGTPKVEGVLAPVVSRVLGGWSLNAIGYMQSGMPVTVVQANNLNSFAGFVLQRPNVTEPTALPAGQRTTAHFFRTAAFSAAPEFTLGNASRNPARGPAYRDLDVAAVKHTAIAERFDLELRAEVFDITNTPAFGQPNGSFGAAAFGSITSTVADPRVIQFALRLSR